MSENHDDPRPLLTVLVGVVGMTLIIVVLLLLEVVHRRTEDAEYRRKVILEVPERLRQLEIEQRETLSSYRWIDRERGVVAIPIERAMELLVAESRERRGGM